MTTEIDLSSLPPAAQKILGPGAPAKMQMMAARGIVPGLKPADIVLVIARLSEAADAEVAKTARATLGKLPPPVLNGALQADLDPFVIRKMATAYVGNLDVLEPLVRMPRVDGEALGALAESADEKLGEIIAVNEKTLLENPIVIEKLYMNKRVRMSTADRLLELAVRNNIELDIPAYKEAAAAIQNELIPEPSEEPTFDDVLFKETTEEGERIELGEDEDTHEHDDEGEEKVKDKCIPLFAKIAQMTVTQKIRTALLGSSTERLLLVRDPNRMVAMAAVQSPLLRENEALQISASRSVSEEVLRVVARNRELTRSYQIKRNLVTNPRTPFTFASQLIPHMRDNDLRALAKSKNVPSAIQSACRRQLSRKKAGKS